MSDDEGGSPVEASVETRLRALEERLSVIERLLRIEAAPAAPAHPTSRPFPAPQRPAPPARQAAAPREPFDLEELLGGRVLGWVGGIAVVLAAVFFLVMAVHNGWIDEPTRVILAFAGSALLTAGGIWLYERRDQTQAARAAVAAGIAAFYASDTAATALYHLVPAPAGLAIAGLVGVAATALAIRWSSNEIAGIGIVGALLAPVLVDAGDSTASLVFMLLALVAAVGVLIWRRWSWLAIAAYLVSAPQAAVWLADERDAHLGVALAVTGGFWLLYVIAAVGYELRVPTAKLRLTAGSLLFMNASLTSLGGWAMLHDAHKEAGATAWVLAVAVAHVVLGTATLRGRVSREIAALLLAVGAALAAIGLALALDGPALVAGWAAESVLVAWVARRSGDRRGYYGSAAFVAAAAVHTLFIEAPPKALAYGLGSVPRAVAALVLVIAACLAFARLLPEDDTVFERDPFELFAAVLTLYLGSVLVVELAGGHAGSVEQHAQLALSAFWAVLGLAALVAGLMRDVKPVRLAGLGLLLLAVGKVFVVDLAKLQSGYRVLSFLALGLLLLAGAFAYQRMRKGGGVT